jgi:small subunit ribosomal protein S6e
MEFKIVISDPATGRSYQREIKDPEAKKLHNKKIGDEFPGEVIGLVGYKLKITGGSDKGGFPMKKGIHESVERVLMSKGTGYRPRREVRRRKRVRGEFITEDIIQINTKIVSKGKKKVEELLGIEVVEEKKKPEEKVEKKEVTEEKGEVKKEKGKEEKGVEKKKEVVSNEKERISEEEEKEVVKKEGEGVEKGETSKGESEKKEVNSKGEVEETEALKKIKRTKSEE